MRDLPLRYLEKLRRFGIVPPDRGGVAIADDRIITVGDRQDGDRAAAILSRLDVVSLYVAPLSIPFGDFLIARHRDDPVITPRDTETRTFLHDIPIVRRDDLEAGPADAVARSLTGRKGVLVEGVGIVATGPISVEQGYINVSSLFHALFVHYLEELLEPLPLFPSEGGVIDRLIQRFGSPLSTDHLLFHPGPLEDPDTIRTEMIRVGRYTVEMGLVDSFFGNISCRTAETIHISQTASSLDQLEGCIDPVPFDGSSTAGITASSELAAHRRIYETTPFRTILHGHPKWSVIVSMICNRRGECAVVDCGRECPEIRMFGSVPIVSGEIGAGGLARTVPPVIREHGVALVHGHGLFCGGVKGFADPFRRMVEIENAARSHCIDRIRGWLRRG